jgi:hypothetical protein
MAASRIRLGTRARRRFATLTQTIKRTTPTLARRRSNPGRGGANNLNFEWNKLSTKIDAFVLLLCDPVLYDI